MDLLIYRFCHCRVNRRIPLMAYYFSGGIALICVFIIQLAGNPNDYIKVELTLSHVPKDHG